MIIKEIKLSSYPYVSRRGLSEYLAKHYFLKKGYTVFRGHMVLGKAYSLYYPLYPNVQNKYNLLERILLQKLQLLLYLLRDDLKKQQGGLPDFFCYKKEDMFFAEIKLEHEQLKKNQLQCIRLLERYGFEVLVFRLKKRIYREVIHYDLDTNVKSVLLKQEKMKLHWK
ncbi:VRR-NUC domain-containing protein [Candidatus Woesearchaeota archaeon]|nr:VRR-NUC domain-containing protein [Candidatus Woesearchaeota archaeon]